MGKGWEKDEKYNIIEATTARAQLQHSLDNKTTANKVRM